MSFKISTQDFITTMDTGQGKNEAIKVEAGQVIAANRVNPGNPEETLSQSFSLDLKSSTTKENTLVTPWAARQMIKQRFLDEWDDAGKQDEKLAVEFSKKMLLLILAQNDCEGIRFSFCKFNGEVTLVAFGIEKDGTLIGEHMFKENFDTKNINDDPPPGTEQGNGISIGQFKAKLDSLETTIDFNKVTDAYFKSLRF